jgi:3,4-dihydroxy 2-butanone 4-phosphate synthase/GTP cyclohydrolase II
MYDTVEEVVEEIRSGRVVIVFDPEREGEADFTAAAERITPEIINFMIKEGRGLLCVPLMNERVEQLGLKQMIPDEENTEVTRCKFTVSVDSNNIKTTGITSVDRAATIKDLINQGLGPNDFMKPGHVFPLRAEELASRQGHTEAAIELTRMAGLYPAGVICEILNDRGDSANKEELLEIKNKFNLKMIEIKDILEAKQNIK